ncbi:MAG: tRNA uridine-5-carboxymethylaminomethyl(34) synthesis GTPase MnmE [Desulfovibrionaceae bacterium]|nr:tRNA uridine-5-carboxymethylaminomethyl(34) synthesis GTPase MnmE [Desulfovibrionaceae bacterium]
MNETIAAVATPPGNGGIGIVRISGPEAKRILSERFRHRLCPGQKFRPWTLHRGSVLDMRGEAIDDALAVFMPGPHTFTGEDTAELQCHGGAVLLQTVLEACLASGARLARRGEFSRRAFLNGRMDLTQAEAISELISAPSKESVHIASGRLSGVFSQKIDQLREKTENLRSRICLSLDFPDDEYPDLAQEVLLQKLHELTESITQLLESYQRTRFWRDGARVAIAGDVNSGKSSLLNALLGRERAIVTDIPGTTRDFLEESLFLDGIPVRLIDTAGLRETDNPIEAQGISMGRELIEQADAVIFLIDGSLGFTESNFLQLQNFALKKTILIWNKTDIRKPHQNWDHPKNLRGFRPAASVAISAKTGYGIDKIGQAVREVLSSCDSVREPDPDEAVPNLRQANILETLLTRLRETEQAVSDGLPLELCSILLEQALANLADVTGLNTSEEVLNRIFDSFCIGK